MQASALVAHVVGQLPGGSHFSPGSTTPLLQPVAAEYAIETAWKPPFASPVCICGALLFTNVNVPSFSCVVDVAFESASSMRIVYVPSGTITPFLFFRSHVAFSVPVWFARVAP